MNRIVILDVKSGNLRSLEKAFEHIGCEVEINNSPQAIEKADRIVLPGQGAYATCMNGIKNFRDSLEKNVLKYQKPFLGICVGMQVMTTYGFEHQKSYGLDWVGGKSSDIDKGDKKLCIPHMGWNKLMWKNNSDIINDLKDIDYVYFAHSYVCYDIDKSIIAAECEYGNNFTAALVWKNCLAVQFHPEKSQEQGLHLLKVFSDWQP